MSTTSLDLCQRDLWKFKYGADKVLVGAKTKFDFHYDRHEWWEKKKTEVMDKIKAEGLEVDESVAAGYSNSGRDASVSVRNDLLRDLRECVAKISEHKEKVRVYHGWTQVLAAQGTDTLELTANDWLFFFGK